MASVNAQLQSAAIEHQIEIQRYSNGVVRKIIAMLNKVDPDLVMQMQAKLERLPASSFTVDRLDKMLSSLRDLNSVAYAQIKGTLNDELKELVGYEGNYQYELFKSSLPAQVSFNRINVEQVYAAVTAQPFSGKLLSEWADSLATDKITRIRDAVRMGYVEGEPISQIVQRIRGTQALNYSDGILEITRRNAEAVVRTAIAHTANFTRDRFFDDNVDVIKGYKYTATLDSRTTPICQSRDGHVYKTGSAKPAVPAHFNCRSVYVPVVKSWQELGIDAKELPATTRASMDGQVPADTSYGDWLAGKPPEFQDRVLGKVKGLLFRKGGLTLDRFVNNKGQVLSLAQLRQQNVEAFQKAGLYGTDINDPPQTGIDATKVTWASNTAQARWHDNSFAKSPEYIQHAVAKYDGKFGSLGTNNKGAYFNQSFNLINMPPKMTPDSYRYQSTWRHEYGHFLDFNLRPTQRSLEADFVGAMTKDTDLIAYQSGMGRRTAKYGDFVKVRSDTVKGLRDRIMALDADGRKAYISLKANSLGLTESDLSSFISRETIHSTAGIDYDVRVSLLMHAIENKDAPLFIDAIKGGGGTDLYQTLQKGNISKFSDLVGSASRNRVLGYHVAGGHTNAYLKLRGNPETEVFANLTALLGTDEPVWHATVKAYYPNLSKVYEDILINE